ncbi:MAG: succinate dehydrogenase / fumarate reductase, cytochrome b subunit [Fimbriimonadaceae bacterium]|jgi:succinate dehydrogenase / fumarate reductase cytochrome b subunit|nr:succinate dehydrogenase / fumarate reductase, cytochrome b subunit [Fimbriimonadaceae bacterium]
MAVSLTKENYFWHKVHSLTGIIPVGFYMLQHLTLNSFSLAGPAYFNGVIGFFEGMPFHFLFLLELVAIWLPLAFHAVYGLFIVNRASPNYFGGKYGWSQNRMYTFQRYSGVFLVFFLIYHVITTTGKKYFFHSAEPIRFAAMQDLFTNHRLVLLLYVLGVLCASYHLCYGIWNFCIRWGITISERAQLKVQRFAFWMFIVVTLLGWSALVGFLMPHGGSATTATAMLSL